MGRRQKENSQGRQEELTGFLLTDGSAGSQQDPHRAQPQGAPGYWFLGASLGLPGCKPHPDPMPKETKLLEGEGEQERAGEVLQGWVP